LVTDPLTGLAAAVGRTRDLAAHAECPRHPDNPPVNCGRCRSDRLAAHDQDGLAEAGRMRALDACDRLFPRRYRDAVADEPGVVHWVRQVTSRPDPPSLLLAGKVAMGKTWQAYGALRAVAYLDPTTAWVATTFADFTASLRPRPNVDTEAEMDRYRSAGVLLLDDLGAGKGSEWVEEVTYRLVNHRYDAMRPTIWVTNLGPDELRGCVGDRIASRLAETCTRVVLDGPDRRRLRVVA
jgi:DNA replication protein DnaC